MTKISSLCVYCGSRTGHNGKFKQMAERFGQILAENNIRLVYGGGDVGLMGIIAHAVMEHGGEVMGIIPKHLDDTEVGLRSVHSFHVVDNMHDRKRMMFDHSDAFVALPGSIGTVDETIEVITWKQLKLHDKPIIILNADGYWEPLIQTIQHFIDQGFTKEKTKDLFHVVEHETDILPLLDSLPQSLTEPKNTLF